MMEDFEDDETMLEDQFNKATKYLPTILTKLDTKMKLLFYGLYKQATVGPCNIPKPGYFSLEAKSKWNAWNAMGHMDKLEAMKQYIESLNEIESSWYECKVRGAVFVSRPIFEDETKLDSEKSTFDFVKEGNLTALKPLVLRDKGLLQEKDEEGMSLLHWAADRGFSDVVEFLLSSGADVDFLVGFFHCNHCFECVQDSMNQTALIYGAAANHVKTVEIILKYNPDISIKDEDGLTAFELTTDETIKTMLS